MPAIFDTDHIRFCLRYFAGILTIPFAFGVLSVWSLVHALLGLIAGGIAFTVLLAAGALLFGWDGVRASGEEAGVRRATTAAAAPVLALCAFCLAWPTMQWGSHVAALGKLAVRHQRYAGLIEEMRRRVANGDRDCCAWIDGTYVSVDVGPPLRAALDVDAMGDNWSGFVFDPSGAVMLANAVHPATGRSAAPGRVTELFGGDLVACRWLWGDYYRCTFT